MAKPIAAIAITCFSAVVFFCCVSSVPAGVLNLGPEEIVTAAGADLWVPGYSVPLYADFNSDGRTDLVVGEGGGGYAGKIRVYLNQGTAGAPQFSGFSYVQSQGADLVAPASGCLGAFPRIASFNDDDLADLLVGQADGRVMLYLNVGSAAAPAFDGGRLLEVGPSGAKSPIDVGSRATIAVADFNNDDVLDLVLGALDGRVRLYLNEGTDAAPDFLAETILQDLAGPLLVPSGRSSPVVGDLDGDGKKDLLVGNTDGQILLYSNIGTDVAPQFSAYDGVTADGGPIDLPSTPRARPTVADWTGDGLPDLLVGAGDGKVRLYQSVPEPASWALLAAGALAALLLHRKRRVTLLACPAVRVRNRCEFLPPTRSLASPYGAGSPSERSSRQGFPAR
ncbi:MAG: VCBS repeat-containing protein [Pirellulales bacterium]|nr:VCBS repeat-containing protein [Pirellulales bacterium]